MSNEDIIRLLKDFKYHLQQLESNLGYDYQVARTFLNKNRPLVERILKKAGTLKYVHVAPPPLFGGYMMRNVNPLDLLFDSQYGLDIRGHLSDFIEQTIGIIEADSTFASKLDGKPQDVRDYDVWSLIHPSITEVSMKRMKDGYFADAVESACKALNARVREIVQDQTGQELDGASLMRRAFSPSNPVIRIASLATKSGHDVQQGYMDIFAGVMTGIRNPKAHDNETITKEDAFRKLMLMSLLMYKIDERSIEV